VQPVLQELSWRAGIGCEISLSVKSSGRYSGHRFRFLQERSVARLAIRYAHGRSSGLSSQLRFSALFFSCGWNVRAVWTATHTYPVLTTN